VIRKTPGATYYDISKALNWDVKKAKRTAEKLEVCNRVRLEESERNHRKIVQVIEIDKPRPTSTLYPNYRTWYYKGEYLSRDEAYRKYFDDCDKQKPNDKPWNIQRLMNHRPADLEELWSVNPRECDKQYEHREPKTTCWAIFIHRRAGALALLWPDNGPIKATGTKKEMEKLLPEVKAIWEKRGLYEVFINRYY
jgi:hypothetical protein